MKTGRKGQQSTRDWVRRATLVRQGKASMYQPRTTVDIAWKQAGLA